MTFEDWFDESEKVFDDVKPDNKDMFVRWLKAAYQVGHDDGCTDTIKMFVEFFKGMDELNRKYPLKNLDQET